MNVVLLRLAIVLHLEILKIHHVACFLLPRSGPQGGIITGMRGVNEVSGLVERVLQSDTFRNAPSSRRLLKYLAERSAAGDADQLKEYTIGVDAFGKGSDYNPRQDSTVRIQIGRLRQKLADYYSVEGKLDAAVLELPKGRFSLISVPRQAALAEVPELEPPAETAADLEPFPSRNPWRVATVVLAGVCLVLAGWGLFALVRLRASGAAATPWSPELTELWQPLVGSPRPLSIAVGDPLFLQFENRALYRELSKEKAEDLLNSPHFESVDKALGGLATRPVHYYAAVGEVGAAFVLGQRLGPYQRNMSVVRSSQLQWQQLADSNVLLLGPPRFFVDKLGSLPVSLEITEVADGFLNVHPQPGEPSLYPFRDPRGFLTEDGEACVLVTHTAGPEGNTDVETFASNSTFARVGAVNAFTDPAFARMLVGKMRGTSGHIPRYFQVLLKVKYKGGVPTETSYILHRSLQRH